MSASYADKLKDDRWQVTREIIIRRDHGKCVRCGSTESLQVHHGYYMAGFDPWEYPHETLWTLCKQCHRHVTYVVGKVHEAIGRVKPSDKGNSLRLIRWFVECMIEIPAPCQLESDPLYQEWIDGREDGDHEA